MQYQYNMKSFIWPMSARLIDQSEIHGQRINEIQSNLNKRTNEANVRARAIDPIMTEVLEFDRDALEREFRMKCIVTNKNLVADYSYRSGRGDFLVEAKSAKTRITKSSILNRKRQKTSISKERTPLEQAVQYLDADPSVPAIIVTNGWEWALIRRGLKEDATNQTDLFDAQASRENYVPYVISVRLDDLAGANHLNLFLSLFHADAISGKANQYISLHHKPMRFIRRSAPDPKRIETLYINNEFSHPLKRAGFRKPKQGKIFSATNKSDVEKVDPFFGSAGLFSW